MKWIICLLYKFIKYLKAGGYPALLSENIPRETIIQGYYESMIFKDIAGRNKIKEKLFVLKILDYRDTKYK